jgi:hypothetical protein
MRLVEKTEAHVVIGLLLLLSLLLSGGSLSGTTGGSGATSSGGSTTGTAGGNGSKLLRAGSDQLRQVSVCAQVAFNRRRDRSGRIPR